MLYIVPTPVGNKEDITLRALKLFGEVKYFICEDTRTTRKLLSMYDIAYDDKVFYSLTSFTRNYELDKYIGLLKDNDIVLVSEAGTPGLSDPGKTMIKLCNENNIAYTVLPGANALIPAVVGSGFDTSKFLFVGFLPQKKGRKTILKNIIEGKYDMPVFFYESVHRFEKLLSELDELGFTGKISVSREISKVYEQIFNGSLQKLHSLIKSKDFIIKGEFVIGLYV